MAKFEVGDRVAHRGDDRAKIPAGMTGIVVAYFPPGWIGSEGGPLLAVEEAVAVEFDDHFMTWHSGTECWTHVS